MIWGKTKKTREVGDHVFDENGVCIYCGHMNYVFGDFDGNSEITVSDALAALRVSLKLVPITPEILKVGDINKDGNISVFDVLKILRVAAKLVEHL